MHKTNNIYKFKIKSRDHSPLRDFQLAPTDKSKTAEKEAEPGWRQLA